MDLSRVNYIRDASMNQLLDVIFLETLICKLGFNDEILHEQPKIVVENTGGLYIWQYPNQFSKYLHLLSQLNIQSYLEIGCRKGGTFVLTCEYLRRFHNMTRCTAVDIIYSPVIEYCDKNPTCEFIQINSQSAEFSNIMNGRTYDLVLIDGDHSYEGAKQDYLTLKDKAKIVVFHDITNDACPGVRQLWAEIKYAESDSYTFHEFTEQYAEVVSRENHVYLGIGVAIKRLPQA